MTPVVVTRFSIRGFGRETPSEEWIRSRFALLKRIGAPGLVNTSHDVIWCLLADPATVELVEALVARHLNYRGFTTMVVLADGGEVNSGIGITPLEDLPIDEDGSITFRIDSDDGLLPGTVDRVVSRLANAPFGTLINLPDGYQLGLERNQLRRLSIPLTRQGPFLVLRRTRDDVFDVGGDHRDARTDRPVLHLRGRSWIQTVHGDNVLNAQVSPSLRRLRHLGDRRVLVTGSRVFRRRAEDLLDPVG